MRIKTEKIKKDFHEALAFLIVFVGFFVVSSGLGLVPIYLFKLAAPSQPANLVAGTLMGMALLIGILWVIGRYTENNDDTARMWGEDTELIKVNGVYSAVVKKK